MKSLVLIFGLLYCRDESQLEYLEPKSVNIQKPTINDNNQQNGCFTVDIVNGILELGPEASSYQKHIFSFFTKDKTIYDEITQISDHDIANSVMFEIKSKSYILGYISLLYQIFKNNSVCKVKKQKPKQVMKNSKRIEKLESILALYRKKIPEEYEQIEYELFVILMLKCLSDDIAHKIAYVSKEL